MHIYIPKVKRLELEHFQLTEHTLLLINKWGIPEPVKGKTINTCTGYCEAHGLQCLNAYEDEKSDCDKIIKI